MAIPFILDIAAMGLCTLSDWFLKEELENIKIPLPNDGEITARDIVSASCLAYDIVSGAALLKGLFHAGIFLTHIPTKIIKEFTKIENRVAYRTLIKVLEKEMPLSFRVRVASHLASLDLIEDLNLIKRPFQPEKLLDPLALNADLAEIMSFGIFDYISVAMGKDITVSSNSFYRMIHNLNRIADILQNVGAKEAARVIDEIVGIGEKYDIIGFSALSIYLEKGAKTRTATYAVAHLAKGTTGWFLGITTFKDVPRIRLSANFFEKYYGVLKEEFYITEKILSRLAKKGAVAVGYSIFHDIHLRTYQGYSQLVDYIGEILGLPKKVSPIEKGSMILAIQPLFTSDTLRGAQVAVDLLADYLPRTVRAGIYELIETFEVVSLRYGDRCLFGIYIPRNQILPLLAFIPVGILSLYRGATRPYAEQEG